jgi:tetratricopeptide (TPR) repeat protein
VLRDGTIEAAITAANEIESISAADWRYSDGWRVMLYAREYDRAVEFLAPIDRVQGQQHDYPRSLMVGWAYWIQGWFDDAEREFDLAREILETDLPTRGDDARLRCSLGVVYAGLGRKEAALLEGRRAAELMPVEKDAMVSAWILHDLAWIYVMTDELDAAVETLDRILSMPASLSIEAVQLDPRSDPLRYHPAFVRLVKKHRKSG